MQQELLQIFIWLVISCLTSFVAYRWGFFTLSRTSNAVSINFLPTLGALGIFLFIQMFIAPFIIYLFFFFFYGVNLLNSHQENYYAGAIFPIVNDLLLIPIFGSYCFFLRNEVSSFFRKGSYFKDFLFGAVTWFIAIPIASFVSNLIEFGISFLREKPTEQIVVHYLKETLINPGLFLALAFFIIFVTPLLEELLFRGFIQNFLKSFLGMRWAIIFTSILFSLFHYSSSQSLDNLIILAVLFILSCFLGFIYERQQSLLAPMGLHSMFNAVTITTIFLNDRGLINIS